MADDVDRDAKRSKLECTKKKLCFIHVSQSLTLISGTCMRKCVTCHKRWAAVDGEKAELCRQSYKVFTDEEYCKLSYYAHERCYKRICDQNKLQKADEQFSSNKNLRSHPQSAAEAALSCDKSQERKSTRLQMQSEASANRCIARNEYVLPVQCIICHIDQFVMVRRFIFM